LIFALVKALKSVRALRFWRHGVGALRRAPALFVPRRPGLFGRLPHKVVVSINAYGWWPQQFTAARNTKHSQKHASRSALFPSSSSVKTGKSSPLVSLALVFASFVREKSTFSSSTFVVELQLLRLRGHKIYKNLMLRTI
jgi:hypothetical protein